ncbi:lactate racemase [Geotalea daltonii FRC-32]|uniref:Lactate racemase n=1 Tax=Geotalea daltonii (strain DSM 22248 / JCM 15807 / FRC-32) TaxID=316067 RepID=B9M1P9_GEODF|nr:nickel-dependent lactate racemase [Geotalea daltonii]ACM19195.1 lactate racemase [Geotalea daltonii FRC-32]
MLLRYGETTFSLQIPPGRLLGELRTDNPASDPPFQLIDRAISDCEPYLSSFTKGEKVVIVTSDITRYTGSDLYLPLLVDRLNQAGISDRDIEIVVALGIHRHQSEQEHKKILGALHGRIRVTDHDCDNPGKLAYLGNTSTGIGVEINRSVAEADRVILTGTIGFHYFAGFGGGRKSILPGVASRRACMASHFTVLNPEPASGKNPFAATGVLDGNPVHQAMVEACAMVDPDFIFNTVLSPDKRIIAAFAGDWRKKHLEGCSYYADHFSCRISEKADLVIVSCGGFPKDINFIQAHKSMEYASHAVKDGGVMILLARCNDGYGHDTFHRWFRFKDLDSMENELREHYEINGQTAYATLQKAQRFRVILVSDLPPEEVAQMGMTPAGNLDEAMDKVATFLPSDFKAYVIPEGGNVLPVLDTVRRSTFEVPG